MWYKFMILADNDTELLAAIGIPGYSHASKKFAWSTHRYQRRWVTLRAGSLTDANIKIRQAMRHLYRRGIHEAKVW